MFDLTDECIFSFWCIYWTESKFYCVEASHMTNHSIDIENNIWVAVNKDVFGHEWGDSPIIFTSDTVTSKNYWRITPAVIKNSLCTAIHMLFYSLHAFLALKHKQMGENSHRSIAAPMLFTVGQWLMVLWRHTTAYRDVVLTDCHQNVSKWVMCIFPPLSSWSSLVNYRVRFTAFSLASM